MSVSSAARVPKLGGSSDIELTFRVPNERDDANTVELQVYLPANLPLLTVDVLPVPGWTATVGTRTQSTPVQTDDGPVDQVVTDIAWTATAGGTAPGRYQDFAISVGQLPGQAGQIIFKSLQTYSSGQVVRWIQVATPVYPDPATSAPILTLTNPTPASVATTTSGSSGTTEALAVAALAVAVLALLGVVLLLIRGRRRGTGGGGLNARPFAAQPVAGPSTPGPDGRVTTGGGAPDPAPHGSRA